MGSDLNLEDLRESLIQGIPWIDVRAPVEFAKGHLPGAVNLPLLNDDERAQVGTTYKQRGQSAAIELGHRLISGNIKSERIEAWLDQLRRAPHTQIYCFRGGLRSHISQQWIHEAGFPIRLLTGGYKLARSYLSEQLNARAPETRSLLITGPTGSRKTHLLHEVQKLQKHVVIDLEGLANHRGSAFGASDTPQPQQATFESLLSVEFLKNPQSEKIFIFEDESRMIGRSALPVAVFEQMRTSPVVWVDEPLQSRVEAIFQDYILNSLKGKSKEEGRRLYGRYHQALTAISRRLGGLQFQQIQKLLQEAETAYLENDDLAPNRAWIERLLVHYYDPIYNGNLERRQVQVLFKGRYSECVQFLAELRSLPSEKT